MTSSPEPIASWTPPDLDGPATIRRNGKPAATPAANGRPSLSPIGEPSGAEPRAWALPELAAVSRAAPPRTPEDEAYAIGFADGARQGEAKASENLRPVLDALFRAAEQIEASRERFEHDRERNLRGLALAVAKQLLQREVASDPTIVRDLVARALELMPPGGALQVRLHPGDLQAIAPELVKLIEGGRDTPVEWSADPSIPSGSFVVESPLRLVDGRTDSALRTLFDRLEHD